MKFIVLIAITILGSCVRPPPKLKKHKDSLGLVKDTNVNAKERIIDPVIPYAFDIKYKKTIKITPDIFPLGITGIGIIKLYINPSSKIERFKIELIRIKDHGEILYSYYPDKDTKKDLTNRLEAKIKDFTDSIVVTRINKSQFNSIELYDITVKLE